MIGNPSIVRKLPLLLVISAFALSARPAHAYLDPASGSMMLQLVLGGVAGAAVALKLFWRKIRGAFTPGRRGTGTGPAGPERPGGV